MDTSLLKTSIRKIVKRYLIPPELLTPKARTIAYAVKEVGDYASIRERLRQSIFDTIEGYLIGTGTITAPKNTMTTALAQAYIEAADTAWLDAGAELPLDAEVAAWARGELDAQFGYADSLFQTLKELRKEDDFSPQAEANARAEGYARSLDGFYGQVKVRAAGNIMLTFDGTDGDENHICQSINGTCVKLKGARHRASWWVAHDLIPYPGNENYDCGAWRCQHYLRDDDGNIWTQSGKTITATKGGPGSGNFDHAGRPGLVGGSAPNEGIVDNKDNLNTNRPDNLPKLNKGDSVVIDGVRGTVLSVKEQERKITLPIYGGLTIDEPEQEYTYKITTVEISNAWDQEITFTFGGLDKFLEKYRAGQKQ